MTIQDMKMAIMLELDKNVISNYPSFTDEQIDYFINTAYLMVINKKVTGNNALQIPFEGTVKRTMDLSELIIPIEIVGSKSMSGVKNEYLFKIADSSSGFLYPVQQTVRIETSNRDICILPAIVIKHSYSNLFKFTETNDPWIPEAAILFRRDEVVAYIDSGIISTISTVTLNLDVIKRPLYLRQWNYDAAGNKIPNVNNDSTRIPEISEHVHHEIVSQAVSLLLENIESNRTQTQIPISQNNKE